MEDKEILKIIDKLVANAQVALAEYMSMTQKQIDKIVHEMALAGLDAHMSLAKMTVEETKRGIVEDKVIKNIFSTEYIWHDIKRLKSVGIVERNDLEGYIDIAEPIGVVAGVTPVTNPTSTTMFKSLICAKTRNPVIFAFHPAAQKCSAESARILRDAAVAHGAPEHCIQWIETPSKEATAALMNHFGVSLILATGGPGLVEAAYSCGKPALGVGPGNVPCYINKKANLPQACTDLMISKTFDNGMICASEQGVIVDLCIADKFEKYMKEHNCFFLSDEETQKLTDLVIDKKKGVSVNSACVGQSASWIAEKAGIAVPAGTKILLAKLPEPSLEYPLSVETLMPVLAYFVAKDADEGIAFSKKMLELGGLGHSAVIHTEDEELALRFGKEMQVGRIIINSPSSHGAIGGIYHMNKP